MSRCLEPGHITLTEYRPSLLGVSAILRGMILRGRNARG